MAEITPRPPDGAPPPPTPRFGWLMRIFLFVLLFDMIFRSFSVLYPWKNWMDELGMDRAPVRLPTRDEYFRLRDAGGDALRKELDQSFASIREYVNPWPNREVRAKLTTWDSRGKYLLAWLSSRLDIVENMIGFNEEWPMFAPNVPTGTFFARARLVYADGTEETLRQNAEPADYTRFARWNIEKVLDHELKVEWNSGKAEECWGWCRLVAHRRPHNAAGSPLKTVLLYRVWVEFPKPGDDARAFLLRQMELTRDHDAEEASSTFYTFDVEKREGKMEPRPSKADE